MSRHKWTVTLADCQQAVLAVVLGNADATENATEYVVRPMGIDAAVAVKSENTRHLPAPSEFTAVRKCRGIEIGSVLGKAQRIGLVVSGTHPPLRSDSQNAHQYFHRYAPTDRRCCFSHC